MKWFKDIYSRQIRLTDERKKHIEADHPEMVGWINKIQVILRYPDKVIRSMVNQEVELFYRVSIYVSTGAHT